MDLSKILNAAHDNQLGSRPQLRSSFNDSLDNEDPHSETESENLYSDDSSNTADTEVSSKEHSSNEKDENTEQGPSSNSSSCGTLSDSKKVLDKASFPIVENNQPGPTALLLPPSTSRRLLPLQFNTSLGSKPQSFSTYHTGCATIPAYSPCFSGHISDPFVSQASSLARDPPPPPPPPPHIAPEYKSLDSKCQAFTQPFYEKGSNLIEFYIRPSSAQRALPSTRNQPEQHFRNGDMPPKADSQNDNRQFECSTCSKRFARKSDLMRHERIHTGFRPNVCDICGKQFIQRSALTVHTRVHTGEKPHKCDICLKAFSDSSSLARHRRIHTGKRPYVCSTPGCGKTFTRRTTLTRHLNSQACLNATQELSEFLLQGTGNGKNIANVPRRRVLAQSAPIASPRNSDASPKTIPPLTALDMSQTIAFKPHIGTQGDYSNVRATHV